MAEEHLDYSLFSLLIASTLNTSLKKLKIQPNASSVELDVDVVLSDLVTLTEDYLQSFEIANCQKTLLRKVNFIKILQERKFNEFVSISGKNLIIDTTQYDSKMSKLVLAATAEYSNVLVKNVNDLSKLWQNSQVIREEFEARKARANALEEQMVQSDNVDKDVPTSGDVGKDTGSEAVVASGDHPESDQGIPDPEAAVDVENNIEIKDVSGGVNMEDVEPEEADPDVMDQGIDTEAKAEEDDEEDEERDHDTVVKEINQSQKAEKDAEEEEEEEVEEKKDDAESISNVKVENEDESVEEDEVKGEEEKANNDEDEDEDEEDEDVEEHHDDEGNSGPITRKHSLTLDEPRTRKRSSSPSSTMQHKRFQHIAINLINSIQAHRFSSPFLQPVNAKDAPEYSKIIYEPKDLKNILKSIKSKRNPPEYQSIEQLERDIMLMFANCIMYNKSDTDLVELTKSMKNDVNNIFKLFKDAESDTR
ncbi:hypothetical protein CLIB1423_07S00364 [[Candida] railenensis]|uniref:Bromo domain-containing protein n=1 Tax=[Candida] railenensis TaxID=45579 RepID=A0A9P0QPF6_9ASCO|nr:hypothetical protein CLIB1423_07S00364 [[Candida] railenensis]